MTTTSSLSALRYRVPFPKDYAAIEEHRGLPEILFPFVQLRYQTSLMTSSNRTTFSSLSFNNKEDDLRHQLLYTQHFLLQLVCFRFEKAKLLTIQCLVKSSIGISASSRNKQQSKKQDFALKTIAYRSSPLRKPK